MNPARRNSSGCAAFSIDHPLFHAFGTRVQRGPRGRRSVQQEIIMTKTTVSNPTDLVVAAIAAAFAPMVREAVSEALAEHASQKEPPRTLLDRAGLARELDVSPTKVSQLK